MTAEEFREEVKREIALGRDFEVLVSYLECRCSLQNLCWKCKILVEELELEDEQTV